MSLRRKIWLRDLIILLSLALMTAASLWGLERQRRHVRAALAEDEAVKRVESVHLRILSIAQGLSSHTLAPQPAALMLRKAQTDLRQYKASVMQYATTLPPEISANQRLLVRVRTDAALHELRRLIAMLDDASGTEAAVSAQSQTLSQALGELLSVCNDFISRTQLSSQIELRETIALVCSAAIIAVLVALLGSMWHYQRVTAPLEALRRWCRRAAAGELSVRYASGGDREFAELADDVNRMAEQLDAFQTRLQQMVESKSRELVRSERLASVGFLAAGVAHEINNPLNIISGYAELSLKRLRKAEPSGPSACAVEHLEIIRGEAFRCKQITEKLLSLAKGSGDAREPVSLMQAANDVAAMVRGLKRFRARQIHIDVPAADALWVMANAAEIKQVLLNLLINALEAVAPRTGLITIEGHREAEQIHLSVTDNGRGMSERTIERVFEPFFTDKHEAGAAGVGLGLSITQAIVGSYGGVIHAQSEGPGRGSRFSITLPAWIGAVPGGASPHLPAAAPSPVAAEVMT